MSFRLHTALAQLEERFLYMEKVARSNLAGCTMSKRCSVRLVAFFKQSDGGKKILDLMRYRSGTTVARSCAADVED